MKEYCSEPLLSVIVPIGNMAGQLHFIDSWLNEVATYPLEVILVNDETYLGVGAELEELLKKFPKDNIFVVRGIYGNPGSARNAGLEIANGKWIAFWDSDDAPNIANVWAAIAESDEIDEILVGKFLVYELKTMELKTPIKVCGQVNSVAMNPGIWRMVFRSKTIDSTRFPSLKMGEDQVFLSTLNFATRNLKFIESNLYQYNLGGLSQLTKSHKALRELPFASSMILDHAKGAVKSQAIFDLQLFYRQVITILKSRDLLLGVNGLKLLLKSLKEINPPFLQSSLIAFSRVIRTIRSSGIS